MADLLVNIEVQKCEKAKPLRIVQKKLEKGMNFEEIAVLLELSLDEVKALAKEIKEKTK